MGTYNDIEELNRLILQLKEYLTKHLNNIRAKLKLRSFESRYKKIKHYYEFKIGLGQ